MFDVINSDVDIVAMVSLPSYIFPCLFHFRKVWLKSLLISLKEMSRI